MVHKEISKLIESFEKQEISNKKVYKAAQKYYYRDYLDEAEYLLNTLINSGNAALEVKWLLAKVIDRIALMTDNEEYEDMAIKAYKELLNLNTKKRIHKKIQKEFNTVQERIHKYGEEEYKALEKASRLEKKTKLSPKSWFMLGSNFNIRKDPEFVINAYKNAINMDPKYMPALFRLGYIYQYTKDDDATALFYYIRLVKLNPEDDAYESETTNAKCILDACNNLVKIYYKQKEYKKVLYLLNRALTVQTKYLPPSMLSSVKQLILISREAAIELGNLYKLNIYLTNHYKTTLDELFHTYCKDTAEMVH